MTQDLMIVQITEALSQLNLSPVENIGADGGSSLLGTSAAMQWTLEIAPSLFAELVLMQTSNGDHLLNFVTASESAHEEQCWSDLDLYARVMSKAVQPVRLLRSEAELACFVQGRAKGVEGLIALIPELLVMNRYALVTIFEPWVELARGQIDIDAAGLKAGANLAKQIEGGS